MIRVLIVDDHPVVREGLAAMLSTQRDFEVVGEASDGEEAQKLFHELSPDVILMDLEMPRVDGPEGIRRIRAEHGDARVLVLTAYDTDERILDAVKAGARGYLLKGAPREELFRAIRVVNQGGSTIEPVVARKLLGHMGDLLSSDSEAAEALTEREHEVLELVAKGLRNKEIAQQLYITERTVKFHVSCIFQKLGVSSRGEAIAVAARRRLIRL
ncbi:MAG: response regulator transcription factor [Chloroflexi bacterium]|nr:response regulator transcription factor [Chloroflexota bacterium]